MPAVPKDLSNVTDQELTSIAARWPELSAAERRSVLVETTRRMDSKKQQTYSQRGRLSIKVQRYGRVRDGGVVVETRVLEVTPQQQGPQPAAEASEGTLVRGSDARPGRFGVGFERRRAQGRTQTREPIPQTSPP